MRHETKSELYSLATFVGADAAHLLELARLVAGDELLCSVEDLTEHGAHEVMANLRLYGARERNWIAELVNS